MQNTFQHPWYKAQDKPGNTTTSESQSQQKQASETTGQKPTSPSRVGDLYELAVAYEAMLRGAEVFRNLSCVGDTDLVLEKDGKILRIDVKHMKKTATGKWTSNHNNKPLPDVYHVYIDPENWQPRWNKRHVPIGWEDFWS